METAGDLFSVFGNLVLKELLTAIYLSICLEMTFVCLLSHFLQMLGFPSFEFQNQVDTVNGFFLAGVETPHIMMNIYFILISCITCCMSPPVSCTEE